MSNQQDQQAVSRRGFMKAAAVTALAAAATGGGAAVLKQADEATAVTTITHSAPITAPVPNMAATAVQTNDTLTRLAAAQAENVRLQAALDAANRQLTALQQNNTSNTSAAEELQLQLGQANEKVGVLAGLIALYDQLDEVDMETAVTNGLNTVSGVLGDLLADVPTLEEGIEAGQLALAQVEDQLPVLENGRLWLENHAGKLEAYFAAIENVLAEVVESVGPFLQMLNEWFEGVRKWLPFGLGQKAANVMQSITTLVIETPTTVSGLKTNVGQPLALWLAEDDQAEIPLKRQLIKPLREQVLTHSTTAVQKTRQVETTYTAELKAPVETAVASQRVIRNLIREYRQQHQI